MSNPRKTYTASYAGVTAEITTTRKIAWASFDLYNGEWQAGAFFGGTRANADKAARTDQVSNRHRGFSDYRIVPAEKLA